MRPVYSDSWQPSPTVERVLFVSVGLVLFIAGLLKAREWIANPYMPGDVPAIPALRAAVVNAEFALSLWLLSGAYPRTARYAAGGCFSLFLAVAIRDVLEGRESCGCFGNFNVRPWVTGLFDLSVMGCLIAFVPGQSRHTVRALITAALFLSVAIPITIAMHSAANQTHLMLSPPVVDLGTIQRKSVARSSFTVTNTSSKAVVIASLVPSCNCLEVRLHARSIPPGETISGEVELDPQARPNFTGHLALTVTGTSNEGKVLFTLLVEAELR